MPTRPRQEEIAQGLFDRATWAEMDARPRHAVSALTRSAVPATPGVYALYRAGERCYVGKATSLRARVGGQHLGRGASMTNSALRRNVCQYLGIATAADIKAKRHITTTEEAARVTAWLDGCEFAWVECETPAEALVIETTLRGEFKPQMNRL